MQISFNISVLIKHKTLVLVHKGRLFAIGTMIIGASALVASLAHFFSGPYVYGSAENSNEICNPDNTEPTCSPRKMAIVSNDSNWWYLLLGTQILAGIGATPMFTVALTYLDENVAQLKSAKYYGMFEKVYICFIIIHKHVSKIRVRYLVLLAVSFSLV